MALLADTASCLQRLLHSPGKDSAPNKVAILATIDSESCSLPLNVLSMARSYIPTVATVRPTSSDYAARQEGLMNSWTGAGWDLELSHDGGYQEKNKGLTASEHCISFGLFTKDEEDGSKEIVWNLK